jgi:cyclase
MKSKQFTDWKYVGDPINTAKIFNDKDTDELIVLDVEATSQNREPNYELLKELSAECFLPICYGGGVTSAEVARKVISCGVDKVSINSAHIQTPKILGQISEVIGSSSTVASLDIDLINGDYALRDRKQFDLWNHLSLLESFGAGEVMVQSVPQDGTRGGPDLRLVSRVLEKTSLPVIFGGGVSSIGESFDIWKLGADGVAAGAWFVFSGKLEAVLVTYPPRKRIDEALANL